MASIYCSNCGQLISATSNFCLFCGAAQHGDEAAVYRAQAPTIVNAVGAQAIAQAQKPPAVIENKDEIIPRRHLCGRARWSFVIGYLTYTSIIALLLLIGIVFNPLIFGPAVLVYIFVLYLVAALVHSYFYYWIDERGFKTEYGIIQKNNTSIPFNKIHNVNITRSLSDRILGLARIEVETSGNALLHKTNVVAGNMTAAEGLLPGLTLKQAKKVHDILLEKSTPEE